jgi:hypothetical protein
MALFFPSLNPGSSASGLAQENNLFAMQAEQLVQQARPQMQAPAPQVQADSLFRSGAISPYPNTRFSQPPFSIALPVGEKYQLTGIFPSNASNFLNSGNPQQQQPRG